MTVRLLLSLTFLAATSNLFALANHFHEHPNHGLEYAQTHRTFDLRPSAVRDLMVAQGLKLDKNETVKITVEENPSTGFSWQIDEDATKDLFTITSEYF